MILTFHMKGGPFRKLDSVTVIRKKVRKDVKKRNTTKSIITATAFPLSEHSLHSTVCTAPPICTLGCIAISQMCDQPVLPQDFNFSFWVHVSPCYCGREAEVKPNTNQDQLWNRTHEAAEVKSEERKGDLFTLDEVLMLEVFVSGIYKSVCLRIFGTSL